MVGMTGESTVHILLTSGVSCSGQTSLGAHLLLGNTLQTLLGYQTQTLPDSATDSREEKTPLRQCGEGVRPRSDEMMVATWEGNVTHL